LRNIWQKELPVPRPPRFDLPGIPCHVMQLGNDHQAVFFDRPDYRNYLKWLGKGTQRYGVAVHAWCLMTNHTHLLVTPSRSGALPKLFAYLGRHYVGYINRKYRRTGSLWEDRYEACLVDTDEYLFACYRYIELNPVMAKMVPEPSAYEWSSYRRNALGETDDLVTPHVTYQSLGQSLKGRLQAYRALCANDLDAEVVHRIETALAHNHVLGNDRFRSEIEKMLQRRLGPGRPGRPRKRRGEETK
jgi:putative transposase